MHPEDVMTCRSDADYVVIQLSHMACTMDLRAAQSHFRMCEQTKAGAVSKADMWKD